MKKKFLYMSMFAAAFLVSCKSNEVEETPVVEEIVNEEVVNEEVVEEAPVAEEKSEDNKVKTTTKKTTTTIKSTEIDATNSDGSSSKTTIKDKAKELKETKALSNSTEEIKTETTRVNNKIVKSKEDKSASGN